MPHATYDADMRRWLLTTLVLLLLGAIINVAIAWASALWVDGMPVERIAKLRPGITQIDQPRWRVRVVTRVSSTTVQSEATDAPPLGAPHHPDTTEEETRAWVRAEEARVPNSVVVGVPCWSRTATPPLEIDYRSGNLMEDARGWPMRSLMWLRVVQSLDNTDDRQWGVDIGDTQGPLGTPRVLPLRPIPLGFIVNSLLYASILFVLVTGLLGLRRVIRRRRGHCIACGYDLRGDINHGCPECGWNRMPEASE